MTVDDCGIPTDAEAEEARRHQFGNFVIPADAHIKGFSDFKVPASSQEGVWELRMREQFRPQ